MPKAPRFLTDEHGKKISVVLDIEEYEKMLEELEELDDIRAYDEAKASGETPVPFWKASERAKHNRKRNTLPSFSRGPRENSIASRWSMSKG